MAFRARESFISELSHSRHTFSFFKAGDQRLRWRTVETRVETLVNFQPMGPISFNGASLKKKKKEKERKTNFMAAQFIYNQLH